MKLVHITQYFHPEKGYQENQFARFHKCYFDQVIIITSYNTRLWNSIPKWELKKKDLEYEKRTGVIVIRLRTLPIVISDRVFCLGLFRTLNSINPDYIYAHSLSSPLTIIASYWINRKKRHRILCTIIDDHMVYVASQNRFSSIFYTGLKILFFKSYLTAFERWIAVSEETKDFILNKFSLKLKDRIAVIPLGADLESFKYDSISREKLRNELQIDKETRLIIYTGKRDKKKDPKILLSALKRLLNVGLDYKLLFVGENVDSYDDIIKHYLTINTEMVGRVIFEPPMKNEELYKAYSAADLAIWPNQSSMSMLEAMACRCPVIASDIKVNAERLNNDRGVMFENGNLDSLVNAILEADRRRILITENAFKWVQLYSWEKLARESVSV